MAIIPTETCSGLTDRIAYQTGQMINTFALIGGNGGGDCFRRVTAPQIYEVERDFDTPGREWEISLSGISSFPNLPKLVAIVNAFDTHTQNVGAVSFDTYLTRSGLNVANTFALDYLYIRGSSLSANNVYSEVDVPMGNIQQIVSGTGVWAFTDGQPLGIGSGSFSDTNHCAQQLLAYLGSGITVSSTVTLTVTATKEDGSSTSKNVVFTSSDPANTHRAIGTTSDQFLDVTNITAVGVVTGTPTVFVRQLRERVPGL